MRSMLAVSLVLSLGACGGATTYRAEGSDRAAASVARIEVGKAEGAQRVEVAIDHLAPPDRIALGMTRYAVWVVPDESTPVLAGFLEYDADARTGTLHATTPYERFEVLVTAEADAAPRYPSERLVVRRHVP